MLSAVARLLAVWLGALAPASAQPGAAVGIAFLSVADEAADQARLANLRDALARFDATGRRVQIDHYQISVSLPAAEVHRLLSARLPGHAVVMANTMLLAQAAKKAAPGIPLVFDGASDPRRSCLVKSMARPGGKATGYTSALPAEPKMLEALLDTFPVVRHVLVLVDANEAGYTSCDDDKPAVPAPNPRLPCSPYATLGEHELTSLIVVDDLKAVAHRRSARLSFLRLCRQQDFGLIAEQVRGRSDIGVLVPLHFLFYASRRELIAAIAAQHLPAIYPRKYFLDAGAAVSLSPMADGSGRRAYEIVAQVLRGRDPATIPVEVPFGFELSISVSGAVRSGLQPSRLALRRAKEVRP